MDTLKNLPRLTALMALYNFEDYIESSLMSVVDQDYPNKQIAVIDDASTDNSAQIVENLLESKMSTETPDALYHSGSIKGVPTTLIKLKVNGMQGRARNFGIQYYWDNTDVFALCDSDDLQLPGKFTRFINKYTEFPDLIGCVYGDYYIDNLVEGTRTLEFKPVYSKEHLMRECIVHSNAIFSKKALERVGIFYENESPKEDYGLFLRISDFFLIVHVAEPFTVVRLTNKNSAVAHSEEFHQKQFAQMVQNYQAFCNGKK